MDTVTKEDFFHFRSAERRKVKLALQSRAGYNQVKAGLIDFLAFWNRSEWVDWEKIELVLRDLDRLQFWRMLPYKKFLVKLEARVDEEVLKVLRQLSY